MELISFLQNRTLTPYDKEEWMDAESLAQVERIVTTAVSGAEGRLRQEIGKKTDALGTSIRQEFGSEMRALRNEFGERTDTLATSLREDFGEKFDEAKRHRGVLYEDVLHRFDLVVEGHQALDQRIDKLEAGMEHEFIETRSFIQPS